MLAASTAASTSPRSGGRIAHFLHHLEDRPRRGDRRLALRSRERAHDAVVVVGRGPEGARAVGQAEFGAHPVQDPAREAPGPEDGVGDAGGEVVARVLLADGASVRHDDGCLVQLPRDQVDPRFVQDVGHRRFGQLLLAGRPSGEKFEQVGFDFLPFQVARHPQRQVVPTQDATMGGEEVFSREVLRFEIAGCHFPADGVVAEHEAVELGEGQTTRVVRAAQGALQFLAAPHLDLHRIEAGIEEHVLPQAQAGLEVGGERVEGRGGAPARGPERELQRVLVDLFVDRVGVQLDRSPEAQQRGKRGGSGVQFAAEESEAARKARVDVHQGQGAVFQEERWVRPRSRAARGWAA